ncbi:MAG: DUF1207 domain-containing protein [Nitrospiria bacterium]
MRAGRSALALLASALVFSAAVCAAETVVFPRAPLVRPLLSDPREAQSTLRYLVGSGTARGEASFGDTVWLVGGQGGRSWQMGVQGAVYTRFNRDRDSVGFLDINSIDYTIFLPVDLSLDGVDLRFGIGHLSSHLGESEVQRRIRYEGAMFFDRSFLYRRDFFRVLVSSDLSDAWRLYAGTSYGFHMTPDRSRTAVQAGMEWKAIFHRWGLVRRQWYAGVDVQSWAEAEWALNTAVDIGMRVSRPDETHGLRFSITGYTGRSLQRVLARDRERYIGMGFVFER